MPRRPRTPVVFSKCGTQGASDTPAAGAGKSGERRRTLQISAVGKMPVSAFRPSMEVRASIRRRRTCCRQIFWPIDRTAWFVRRACRAHGQFDCCFLRIVGDGRRATFQPLLCSGAPSRHGDGKHGGHGRRQKQRFHLAAHRYPDHEIISPAPWVQRYRSSPNRLYVRQHNKKSALASPRFPAPAGLNKAHRPASAGARPRVPAPVPADKSARRR